MILWAFLKVHTDRVWGGDCVSDDRFNLMLTALSRRGGGHERV